MSAPKTRAKPTLGEEPEKNNQGRPSGAAGTWKTPQNTSVRIHPLKLTALRGLEGTLTKGKGTRTPHKRFRNTGHMGGFKLSDCMELKGAVPAESSHCQFIKTITKLCYEVPDSPSRIFLSRETAGPSVYPAAFHPLFLQPCTSPSFCLRCSLIPSLCTWNTPEEKLPDSFPQTAPYTLYHLTSRAQEGATFPQSHWWDCSFQPQHNLQRHYSVFLFSPILHEKS